MSTRKGVLDLPTGIDVASTEYEAQGRYVDTQWVRFNAGRPEKIGGWERWNDEGDEIEGVCRSIFSWNDYAFNEWRAFGSNERLVVFDQDKIKTNITPYASTGDLTDPFTTTASSTTVTVAHTAHSRPVGSYVNFSGATAVGGITIDGEYVVTTVTANTYTIEHSAAATSSANGGGTVAYKYEMAQGNASVYRGGGWGVGRWGEGTWGTAREGGNFLQFPRMWAMDNYGQTLVCMPSDGTVYIWDLDIAERAEALANAPNGTFMFVTSERIIVVLGSSGDLMRMDWNDDDDPTDWTPSATNTANVRRLQSGSRLVGGGRLRNYQNLVWSDTSCYTMQWTGDNNVYATFAVGHECGLIGPCAFQIVNGVAFWMSNDNFFMFNGSVVPVPRSDDIKTIFDDMERDQLFKTQAFYNPKFNEVTWWYPGADSEEPDRYVSVSLDDFAWWTGELSRTAWVNDHGLRSRIFSTTEDGIVYEHEIGVNADGEALPWHIETGYIDLDDGNVGVNIDGYVPDFKRVEEDVTITFTTKDLPQDSDALDTVTKVFTPGDAIVDLRAFGRQMRLKLAGSAVDSDFRLGRQRIEVGGRSTKRHR